MAAPGCLSADLPPELEYSPVPLSALFGLLPASSSDHARVWDGFTANRQPDRVPMYYKFCSESDVLTPPKAKVCAILPYILPTNNFTLMLRDIFYPEKQLRMVHAERDLKDGVGQETPV